MESKTIAYTARKTLINFGKSLPFFLCALVAIAYTESAYAIYTNDFLSKDNGVILNTPISFWIADKVKYDWLVIAVVTIISYAIDTCKWNKLAIVYLIAQLLEKNYFENTELYIETIYAIIVVNVAICCFFVWKGIKIVSSAFYNPR